MLHICAFRKGGAVIINKLEGSSSWELLQELKGVPTELLEEHQAVLNGSSSSC